MKILSILCLLCCSMMLYSQNPYEPVTFDDDGNVLMQEVLTAEGKTPDQIYKDIKVWFGDTYSDSKEVLEVDDKDAMVLMGKAFRTIIVPGVLGQVSEDRLWYSIKMEIKDGRFRLSLYDFLFQPKGEIAYADKRPVESWFGEYGIRKNGKMRKYTTVMRDEINATFLGLKESISKKVNEAKKADDW